MSSLLISGLWNPPPPVSPSLATSHSQPPSVSNSQSISATPSPPITQPTFGNPVWSQHYLFDRPRTETPTKPDDEEETMDSTTSGKIFYYCNQFVTF